MFMNCLCLWLREGWSCIRITSDENHITTYGEIPCRQSSRAGCSPVRSPGVPCPSRRGSSCWDPLPDSHLTLSQPGERWERGLPSSSQWTFCFSVRFIVLKGLRFFLCILNISGNISFLLHFTKNNLPDPSSSTMWDLVKVKRASEC